ncbi:HNH endonuclease [Microvirga thermotolerans]|uniref:HNH endonuclease n=1 Tax=Microvirga thermotolerans TaxID=2651334 RepID=A0A5P9JS95_9HYPH|nr:HNH endonuclease signature motif containing protein [Microvirga thermotolerans]QFU15497.1 HNH endonuclease [Microvirga thermotolerans]
MSVRKPNLGTIHHQILDLLKANPDGLTIYEIRDGIPDIGVQQHLDKRVRDLRYYHDIPLIKRGKTSVYIYKGERSDAAADSGAISAKVRAVVLHKAHGRCQMCGRTVAEDGIKLQVDHKIPRNWGGTTTIDNLWALCQPCNGGKRDFFASFNDEQMKVIMAKESVYERIAETLKLHAGTPTPAWLLEFVANADDWQEDWQKRLRELRYPAIGMKIRATRKKNEAGRWEAAYILDEWKDLPSNHKFLIKEHERLIREGKRKGVDENGDD